MFSFAPLVIAVLKRSFHFHRDDYRSIFNDALMVFIQHPGKYDWKRGDFCPLLIQTAKNKARNYLRGEMKHRPIINGIPKAITNPPVVPFFDKLESQEEIQELMVKLERVSANSTPLQKDIIDGFINDTHGKDWARQLAKKHSVTPNYVAVCWKRLREKL